MEKTENPKKTFKMLAGILFSFAIIFALPSFDIGGGKIFEFGIKKVHAQAGSIQGASIVPGWSEDFSSNSFRQSLDNLKATGATDVNLVIPYYQDNIHSTNIYPGWNTPTNQSLADAASYANSIGLKVSFTMHPEVSDGTWRAHINPFDKGAWFASYTDVLLPIAEVAENNNVWLMVLGSELVELSSQPPFGSMTPFWSDLISDVRGVFSGSLSYGANSNTNDPNDRFSNEKVHVGFWDQLDYIGLSAYYGISGDSVSSFKDSWNFWNTGSQWGWENSLMGFQAQHGKPLILTEVGYRSVDGSNWQPWNWGMGGAYNGELQANLYEALFDYWKDYGYMEGAFLWEWESDPNVGWPGNTGYTPQHKPAQEVMQEFYEGTFEPDPEGDFSISGSLSDSDPSVGESATLSVDVANSGESINNTIVNLEIYDSNDQRVHQEFFEGQNFSQGETKSYDTVWIPENEGEFTVKSGVFSSNWSQTLFWDGNVLEFSVGEGNGEPGEPGDFSAVSSADDPNPYVGENLTVSTEVVNNGGSANNTIVDIEIYNSNNEQVFQEFFEGQNFSAGETKNYDIVWAPESEGEFVVRVGIFSGNWTETLLWEGNALEISVGEGNGVEEEFETSASTSSDPVLGEDVSVFSEVTNTGGASNNLIVDIEIYDSNDQRVHQEFFEGQNFGAGEEKDFETSWTPQSEGEFTVRIGVFSSGWSQTLHWNHNALTFNVGEAGEEPEPEAGFGIEAEADPESPNVGEETTVTVEVENHEGNSHNLIVDIEIFDSNDNRVFQEYFLDQDFDAGEMMVYEVNWIPENEGEFVVDVGIFSENWSQTIFWEDEVLKISVGEEQIMMEQINSTEDETEGDTAEENSEEASENEEESNGEEESRDTREDLAELETENSSSELQTEEVNKKTEEFQIETEESETEEIGEITEESENNGGGAETGEAEEDSEAVSEDEIIEEAVEEDGDSLEENIDEDNLENEEEEMGSVMENGRT